MSGQVPAEQLMDEIGKAPATDLFLALTPEAVLDAVENAGLRCNTVCNPLNSYENRVYEVELEDGRRVVAKFYRPGRWTEAQLLEEHAFMADLVREEVAICGNLPFPDGTTLKQMAGIWYCLYERVGGRAPDELNPELARRMGMMAARIHNVGAMSPAPHRLVLGGDSHVRRNLAWLLEHDTIPPTLRDRYASAALRIADAADRGLEKVPVGRIHGDFHMGNLLLLDGILHALDFDDMVVGPAVQDLWLLVPGQDAHSRHLLDCMIEGYEQFREFDRRTLDLIEPLRGLRLVHYAAWLARRWHDPVFPQYWPHFGTQEYWAEETAALEAVVRHEGQSTRSDTAAARSVAEPELTNKDFFFDWEE